MRLPKIYFTEVISVKICLLIIVLLCLSAVGFVPLFAPPLPQNALIEEEFGAKEIPLSQSDFPFCNADSAVLMDGDSGTILFEKNSHKVRGMASTTKIMTALVALETVDPDVEFEIPPAACGIEGSSVYLQEGEILTAGQLLYCLLLESGNDSAAAIALLCCGSIRAFAEKMNSTAEELGLENTHFENPHGLSDKNHYTTAHDLAIITAQAMRHPVFRQIVGTKKYTFTPKKGTTRTLVNHNKLLFGFDGATGVKTGYTKADGKCLVSSASREGLNLIAVTLCDSNPTRTHTDLLNFGFESYEKKLLCQSGEITTVVPLMGGMYDSVTLSNPDTVSLCLPKGTEFSTKIVAPSVLYPPLEKGSVFGYVIFESGGSSVYITPLVATEAQEYKKISFWKKLFWR